MPFFRRERSAIFLGLGALLLVAASSRLAAQGYLSDEAPAPASIDELPSSIDSISLFRQERRAGRLIPRLLRRVPATEDRLQEASLTVKPRAYYRYRDEGNGQIREAFAFGGSLDFESGWLLDTAKIGLSGYTSQKLLGDADRDGTGLLQEGHGGYTALGQAYLALRYKTATARFFRQELDFPYINRHDHRMTPKTFEAYGAGAEEPFGIEGLTLGGIHVTKMKNWTDTDFAPLSHSVGATGVDRGVSVVGAGLEFAERGGLGVVNQYGWDMFNTFYSEAHITRPLFETGFDLRIALQFADQRSVGDELAGAFDTQMMGATANVGRGGLIATFGVTSTGDSAGIRSPWGGDPAFNSVMISDFTRAGEDSYRVGLSYDFAGIGLDGLSAFTNFVHGDVPVEGDRDEWNVTVDYRREDGPLRNFWLRVRGAQLRTDGGPTKDEFRVIMNYSRRF